MKRSGVSLVTRGVGWGAGFWMGRQSCESGGWTRRSFLQGVGWVSSAEVLDPVVGDVADAEGGVGWAEDVGAVAAGVHPGFHNGGGGGLAVGDVFAGGGGVEGGNALLPATDAAGAGVGGAGGAGHGVVVEVVVGGHVGGVVAGGAGEVFVPGEWGKVAFLAFSVDEGEDFLLVGFIVGGDVFGAGGEALGSERGDFVVGVGEDLFAGWVDEAPFAAELDRGEAGGVEGEGVLIALGDGPLPDLGGGP